MADWQDNLKRVSYNPQTQTLKPIQLSYRQAVKAAQDLPTSALPVAAQMRHVSAQKVRPSSLVLGGGSPPRNVNAVAPQSTSNLLNWNKTPHGKWAMTQLPKLDAGIVNQKYKEIDDFKSNRSPKGVSRLDAKQIVTQAKRFQDYELGGHGVQKSRVPYGSALNNFNIVDLKKKIQNSLARQRNSQALNTLQPLGSSEAGLDFKSPKNSLGGPASQNIGRFEKNLKYKQDFTRGHYERIVEQDIPDPFKIHNLTFESTRKKNLEISLYRKQQKTLRLKNESAQYHDKKGLVDYYQQEFGVFIEPAEQEKLFKALDYRALELIMDKKLAEKKQYICAQTIQARFRGYMCRKWYKRVHEIRTLVAVKVQRIWRKYFAEVVIPRRQYAREISVVHIIQKVCRGYLSRKKIQPDRDKQKMQVAFDFFDTMLDEYQDDFQVKVAYFYKRYKKREAAKKKKKSAAATKTKGKKTKTKRGTTVVAPPVAVKQPSVTQPRPSIDRSKTIAADLGKSSTNLGETIATSAPAEAPQGIDEEKEEKKEENEQMDQILNDRDSQYNKDPKQSTLNVIPEDQQTDESPDKVKDEMIDKINEQTENLGVSQSNMSVNKTMFVTNMDEDGAEIPMGQTIRDPNTENTIEETKDGQASVKATTPKPDHEELKEKESKKGTPKPDDHASQKSVKAQTPAQQQSEKAKTPTSQQPAVTPKENKSEAGKSAKTPAKTPKEEEQQAAKTPVKSEAAKSVAKTPKGEEVPEEQKVGTPVASQKSVPIPKQEDEAAEKADDPLPSAQTTKANTNEEFFSATPKQVSKPQTNPESAPAEASTANPIDAPVENTQNPEEQKNDTEKVAEELKEMTQQNRQQKPKDEMLSQIAEEQHDNEGEDLETSQPNVPQVEEVPPEQEAG